MILSIFRTWRVCGVLFAKCKKIRAYDELTVARRTSCGGRAWLNGTTITVGMNNVFDLDPPFVAAALENGCDESTFDIKGRFWYVALKKRF